ncbi:OsmC family protein [Fibrisoma limi BUZ 3]|uniref:OsmC family protein n=1 Tax=Fibrisoma limi BUZ 3 TaxID=1185876 RepID=I2GKM3_9BACT|nr:OsmC family protein [Fibrisoma limi]CCH54449.1 OsmC family protein [Fibrisoma limi BUZ 3]
MNITATIRNSRQDNDIVVETQGNQKTIPIPGKPAGGGSSVNGGELLFLALATCFCNDIYREAARRNVTIESVAVTVTGEFGGEGDPASNISYQVQIDSDSPDSEIQDLIRHVDTVAEIHNTLRKGVRVSLRDAA